MPDAIEKKQSQRIYAHMHGHGITRIYKSASTHCNATGHLSPMIHTGFNIKMLDSKFLRMSNAAARH
jgi:hypothetical protein